jgi:hypothetical protein
MRDQFTDLCQQIRNDPTENNTCEFFKTLETMTVEKSSIKQCPCTNNDTIAHSGHSLDHFSSTVQIRQLNKCRTVHALPLTEFSVVLRVFQLQEHLKKADVYTHYFIDGKECTVENTVTPEF